MPSNRLKFLRRHTGIYARPAAPIGPGETPESCIRTILGTRGLIDVLDACFRLSMRDDVLQLGCLTIPETNEVIVSNNSLAGVVSIAISELLPEWMKSRRLVSNLQKKGLSQAVIGAHCYFHEDSDFGISPRSDEMSKLLHTLGPTMYLQERMNTPLNLLIVRVGAWFAKLPQEIPALTPPQELASFLQREYGLTLREMGEASLLFFAAANHGRFLLEPRYFSRIQNWEVSAPYRLMNHMAGTALAFESPWMMDPVTVPDGAVYRRMPKIVEHPFIRLPTTAGEVFALPFPRALFAHLEETFYWRCFDHFKAQGGRADNAFSIWFGRILERYCFNVLRSCATAEFRDLAELETAGLPGPDAVEVLGHMVTFFEFKSRRLHRHRCLYWGEDSENQMLDFASDPVDQFVRFSEMIARRPEHWISRALAAASRVMLVVVTPAAFPINPFILKNRWFADKMQHIRDVLGLRRNPILVFGGLQDLEFLPRRVGRGQRLGPLWNEFVQSHTYPYGRFCDWLHAAILRGRIAPGANPYVEEILRGISDGLTEELRFTGS